MISSTSTSSRSITIGMNIIATICFIVSVCCAAVLNDDFEVIRKNADPLYTYRAGNLNVLESKDNKMLGFCEIDVFLPYSKMEDGTRIPYPSRSYLQAAMTINLALKHLNEGDGSVIKEIEGINNTCPIRFIVSEFHDTEGSESACMEKTIDVLQRDKDAYPCYILGAARSAVSIPMSIVTGLMQVVQISPISTSPLLDGKDYPLFGRLVPSDDGGAVLTVKYFCDVLHGTHLGIIHSNDGYGNAFNTAMIKAANDHCSHGDYTIVSVDISVDGSNIENEIERAVTILKDTNIKHFFGVIDGKSDYVAIMEEACKQGIAGTGEHLWMFSDSVSSSTIPSLGVEVGSCLHRASIGTGMIAPRGGIPGKPVYDELIRQWESLNNPKDIRYLQARLPSYYPDDPKYVPKQIDDSIFGSIGTTPLYAYDEVIAMGIAACNAIEENKESEEPRSRMEFNSQSLYNNFIKASFEGVTGRIIVNNVTGSREPDSAYFIVINYQEIINTATNTVTFEPVHTNMFEDGAWSTLEAYIFPDGSTEATLSLPKNEVDYNYIGPSLIIVGSILCCIILILSIAFALWTFCYRSTKVVAASQPIFLFIICAGTFLMGLTIIPLSIDDKKTSDAGCTVACMMSPWLFACGFALIFAALFSKTYRINKIFHNPSMKRLQISVCDVIIPLIVLVFINAIVLTVWTTQSPSTWKREVMTQDMFGRPKESIGKCTYTDALPYIIILSIIDLGALTFSLYEAYVARNISTEFAESAYIANSIASVLLVSFIGIPVIIIASEEPRAKFFALSGIIFVICTSILLFIFVPKMYFYHILKSDASVMKEAIRSSIMRDKRGSTSKFSKADFLSQQESSYDNGAGYSTSNRSSFKNAGANNSGNKYLRNVSGLESVHETNEYQHVNMVDSNCRADSNDRVVVINEDKNVINYNNNNSHDSSNSSMNNYIGNNTNIPLVSRNNNNIPLVSRSLKEESLEKEVNYLRDMVTYLKKYISLLESTTSPPKVETQPLRMEGVEEAKEETLCP